MNRADYAEPAAPSRCAVELVETEQSELAGDQPRQRMQGIGDPCPVAHDRDAFEGRTCCRGGPIPTAALVARNQTGPPLVDGVSSRDEPPCQLPGTRREPPQAAMHADDWRVLPNESARHRGQCGDGPMGLPA